jgi:hypothetical protein
MTKSFLCFEFNKIIVSFGLYDQYAAYGPYRFIQVMTTSKGWFLHWHVGWFV